MVKNISKILIVFLILLTFFGVCYDCFANVDTSVINATIKNVNDKADKGDSKSSEGENKVTKIMGGLLRWTSIIGAAISIITLLFTGIKYMAGGVTERAELKKDLPKIIIGATCMAGGSGILKILELFINGNLNKVNS